jgi:6-phosphogluconolactonase
MGPYMPNQAIHIFPDLDALSHRAAERLIALAQECINSKRHFSLCLSGGNTPRRLYRLLATEYLTQLDWNNIHLFWGDERWVPPNHLDSNYAMAYQELISLVPIPATNIHRIPAEINPPEQAALVYEQEIKKYFFSQGKDISQASFDLVLLGLGTDGHTASLFPNDPILNEENKLVAAVTAPDYLQPRQRITLTLPILNLANQIFFLVSGEDKKPVLRSILSNQEEASRLYPAARIQSQNLVEWFVDKPAYM